MQRIMCKSKIHRARVTETDLNYEGSLTLDRDLMDAADLLPYEKVQVVNVNNGSRAETYVIEGQRGDGQVRVNGALARWAQKDDLIIVIAYGAFDESECRNFAPRVVHVDANNRAIAKEKDLTVL